MVDFTAVYRELNNPKSTAVWHQRYLVSGVVEKITAAGTVSLRQTHTEWEFHDPNHDLLYARPREMLKIMAAAQMAKNLTVGGFFTLDPETRRYLRPIKKETHVLVTHCDRPLTVGQSATIVAWPANDLYDCGLPATVSPDKRSRVLVIGREGVAQVFIPSHEERQADEARILDRQKHDAEAGSGAAQYELAKRYLHGLGTETNLALARHWLSVARTNGYEQAASRLLELMPPGSQP